MERLPRRSQSVAVVDAHSGNPPAILGMTFYTEIFGPESNASSASLEAFDLPCSWAWAFLKTKMCTHVWVGAMSSTWQIVFIHPCYQVAYAFVPIEAIVKVRRLYILQQVFCFQKLASRYSCWPVNDRDAVRGQRVSCAWLARCRASCTAFALGYCLPSWYVALDWVCRLMYRRRKPFAVYIRRWTSLACLISSLLQWQLIRLKCAHRCLMWCPTGRLL